MKLEIHWTRKSWGAIIDFTVLRQKYTQAKSAVLKLQSDSTELVRNTVRSISPYMWYTALPQLTSR